MANENKPKWQLYENASLDRSHRLFRIKSNMKEMSNEQLAELEEITNKMIGWKTYAEIKKGDLSDVNVCNK